MFTNYIQGGSATELAAFEEMVQLAADRDSLFVPVLLRCQTSELMERAANDSRVERMKLIDPILIAHMNDNPALRNQPPQHPRPRYHRDPAGRCRAGDRGVGQTSRRGPDELPPVQLRSWSI